MECKSFPPLIGLDPHILVLGSMPGITSLSENQYYAHPHNLFWRIVEDNFGCAFSSSYDHRTQCLLNHHVGLWDVVGSCQRVGSLDSAIQKAVANPIEQLIKKHPTIHTIIFNGKAAEKMFSKEFPNWEHTNLITLPSTSPANASIPRADKFAQWKRALHLAF